MTIRYNSLLQLATAKVTGRVVGLPLPLNPPCPYQ
jgi:hypothetical protein